MKYYGVSAFQINKEEAEVNRRTYHSWQDFTKGIIVVLSIVWIFQINEHYDFSEFLTAVSYCRCRNRCRSWSYCCHCGFLRNNHEKWKKKKFYAMSDASESISVWTFLFLSRKWNLCVLHCMIQSLMPNCQDVKDHWMFGKVFF